MSTLNSIFLRHKVHDWKSWTPIANLNLPIAKYTSKFAKSKEIFRKVKKYIPLCGKGTRLKLQNINFNKYSYF